LLLGYVFWLHFEPQKAPLTKEMKTLIVNHMVNYRDTVLDNAFAALSSPVRRAILARLSQGEATVGELATPHDISLPAISKHVSVLVDAGLVLREKRGREYHCRLQPDPMREAVAWLAQHQHFWEQQFDALDNFLSEDGEDG
jgi:DNA-binding transcriptional ArsR family regulator